jgi:glycosyltransferase involved in cell wall biosynthesis
MTDQATLSRCSKTYVLVTAAYNEEKYIGKTIDSIVSQTLRPQKWIIVSDGSTDKTDEIVRVHAEKHAFIKLHRVTEEHPRNFAAQVKAINCGYALLKDKEFDFIANLDADVSFDPIYYEALLRKFEANPNLGLAGGFVYEDHGKGFRNRRTNGSQSVAHAVQMFRRSCFESIGGYLPLRYGGPDWVAEVMVRQQGWGVQAFPELVVHHYRPAASAGGFVRGWYRQGLMDYSLGSVPLFEIVKCVRRIPEHPFVIGALARLAAFGASYVVRAPRLVPPEFMRYLREEQRQRLRAMIRSGPKAQELNSLFETARQKTLASGPSRECAAGDAGKPSLP